MAREIVTSENREEYNNKKMGIKPDEKEENKVHLEHKKGISHIFHNNKKVGEIKHQDKDGITQILKSDVEKEHQRKGIGIQAYHQFIEHHLGQGKSVGSDSMLTEQGQGVWNKLKEKYNVEKSKNAMPAYPANLTTVSREWRLANRPKTREYDSSYLSGHEPVYTIHPKKED